MSAEKGLSARVPAVGRDQFAADVRYYLLLDPRQLPSRYLYDDLGSALFEAICHLPWYGLTRAEIRLLRAHAREILSDDVSTVVELGSGSGEKLSTLIDAGLSEAALDVHLIDLSARAMEEATFRLGRLRQLRIHAHQTTYEAGLETFAASQRTAGRALVAFLGSNIGNFDPPGREAFLRLVRRAMHPGDRLLLGTDLIKPPAELQLAYDDPLGITAAFNRNLLVRINRELEADFDLGGFAHRARWNAAASRVEMHLVSRRAQRIRIAAAALDFSMGAGESIWTESSYKFRAEDAAAIVRQCGFRVGAQWIDREAGFALTCADAS
jgi:dimethylhistidine N-methyltransferase